MHMYGYESRTLGAATLELFSPLKSQISFSDFCPPAATIEFAAHDEFLSNSLRLFRLSFPGHELEATVHEGRVFIKRNGLCQHSEQYVGKERCEVAIQWDTDSIACGVKPASSAAPMDQHMRAVHTPVTVPPLELVRLLRTENLLFNSAYRTIDDLFGTVVDCLYLSNADIRRHGGEKFVWRKNGDATTPLDEPDISRYIASFLSAHGAAKNFDVTCESIAGTGNIDFYIVGPILDSGLGKIAIEAKKADSAKLVQGFQIQLPEYMARIGTNHGIYLVYWLQSALYPHPSQSNYAKLEIEKLRPIPRLPGVRTVGMNLSLGPTPSKQNA